MYDEDQAWLNATPEDLWLFDKLIVARSLGYICGPAGVDVPAPGHYIVRPCVNVTGMGKGASIQWIEEETDDLPPGTFWCEVFAGRHLSVDYQYGDQVLCVEGHRPPWAPLYRWDRWVKTDDVVECPPGLLKFPHLNCEYIDGKLIEIHLRHNPDFTNNNARELIPVWGDSYAGQVVQPGYRFVEDRYFRRIGFLIPKD